MKEEGRKFVPLHRRVADADQGDAGWVWYEGKWCVGQICRSGFPGDDGNYLEMILESDTKWFHVYGKGDGVSDCLWLPIHRPPYEGDEQPSTHSVCMDGGGASVTMSWRMGTDQGERVIQQLCTQLQELLNTPDAS